MSKTYQNPPYTLPAPPPPHPPGPPLHGLSGQYLHWAAGSGVDLVIHHVLQALVVGWADEDLSVELATCEPVVQNLGGGGGGNKSG